MYISEQKDIRLADVNRKAIFYRRFYKRIREFMYDPVCDGSQDALTEEERRQLKSYLRYVFELTTL
jgi:hypothetical protein